jgi:hypothetical protein
MRRSIFILLACFIVAFFGLLSGISHQFSKPRILDPNVMTGHKLSKQPFVANFQTNGTIALDRNLPTETSRASASPAQVFVHTFFYGWYGTPGVDNSFIHWNHPILPHW